jgi:hypothetical protein
MRIIVFGLVHYYMAENIVGFCVTRGEGSEMSKNRDTYFMTVLLYIGFRDFDSVEIIVVLDYKISRFCNINLFLRN